MVSHSDGARHILSLSGGKDSSALAVFMRDKIPDVEYVFCDTRKELKETYEYLDKLEAYLGKPIVRLNAERGFDHYWKLYGEYLPSPQMRWCTKMLKIRPFEAYVGDDPVYNYVGLRADENRQGYISTKPNIIPVYPFREHGIREEDVYRILEDAGLGLPDYYKWRTRSGCWFCFFQRKNEWAGLKKHHPDLFEKAKEYEKLNPETGERYTWSQGESLEELGRPERLREIEQRHAEYLARAKSRLPNRPLVQILADALDEEDDSMPCNICHI